MATLRLPMFFTNARLLGVFYAGPYVFASAKIQVCSGKLLVLRTVAGVQSSTFTLLSATQAKWLNSEPLECVLSYSFEAT